MSQSPPSRAFISYVSEDAALVDRLSSELNRSGVRVWLDRNELKPGQRWKSALRTAIREGSFFVACFSEQSERRGRSYMREEVTIAIDEIRLRPHDRAWFIPVQLTACTLPDLGISSTETLSDLQYVDLSKDWNIGMTMLTSVLA
ncbi:MAG: hypothetical protein JWQ95_2647 [Sphaerisporangium sp.]|jgi:hypothetical protein|nr:hypothetical protein [Sphaerisporangium sp.]